MMLIADAFVGAGAVETEVVVLRRVMLCDAVVSVPNVLTEHTNVS